MDIGRLIRDLSEERKRLTRIIESLEAMAKSGEGELKARPRRGRKSMDAAARQEVSERMKRYWARRREEKAAKGAPTVRRVDDALLAGAFPAAPYATV